MENNQLKGINRRLPVLRDQVAEARIHVARSLDHLYRSRAASRSTAPASSSLTAREWTAILNSFSNIEKTLKSLNEEAEPNLEEPLHVRAFVPQLGKKRRFNGREHVKNYERVRASYFSIIKKINTRSFRNVIIVDYF